MADYIPLGEATRLTLNSKIPSWTHYWDTSNGDVLIPTVTNSSGHTADVTVASTSDQTSATTTSTLFIRDDLDQINQYLNYNSDQTNQYVRYNPDPDQTDTIKFHNYTNAWADFTNSVTARWWSGSISDPGMWDTRNIDTLNEYRKIELSERDKKKARIRSALAWTGKDRSAWYDRRVPENEAVAMESLREIVSETEFRKYLKYGFVLVEGSSGKTYQIYRNRSHTRVWESGRIVEEICVRIKDHEIPPTDSVIAFKNMIEADEKSFRNCGNVYQMERAA